MIRVGEYLNQVFKLNQDSKNFRFFSPDETYSNKLDKIFDSTKRAWVWSYGGDPMTTSVIGSARFSANPGAHKEY
jgi:phosphoketolase